MASSPSIYVEALPPQVQREGEKSHQYDKDLTGVPRIGVYSVIGLVTRLSLHLYDITINA